MKKIEIYTKDYCPYCKRAKALLLNKGLSFNEYKIDEQPKLRPEMIQRANGGSTVPQIFIGGRHIGGCDDMMALVETNQFDNILAE